MKGIDENRYDESLEEIIKYYDNLKEEVKGVPVGFLFNLDESGEIQFIDARNIYVIVPKELDVTTYPLNKSIKRITLLHCIGSDGTSCDPLLILPRKTLDDEIFDEVPTGRVFFACQPKRYCTHQIFTQLFQEEFLFNLFSQQRRYNYFGKSIIIMDGFTRHDKALETLRTVLEEYKIKILFIPPHSSDQVQPLDLFGFNVQKYKTSKFIFNHHYSYQTNQILAILDGLNEIQSFHAITTAGKMAGIIRKRNPDEATPNDVFLQEHIIEMTKNPKIRHIKLPTQFVTGRQNRLRKYEVLEPNDDYPKRKELQLKSPEEYSRPNFTIEEAKLFRRKFSLR